ncbi:DNA-directed RNA polymerase subunit omega [Andreesenia angusta]|uniref:DNA-directed RNA polymerase subunit omega n=1 Tax=Andreesenia angusta TaxID=39480 RepID=A0A1S1V7P0_9FIRM|nr:DNA-directed RNA polymerase subunit omega [Andreesenia angusta]OHW62636.1 DNA-directed RNA polymerase subunit omega [Andreesenia angusta]
MLYPTTDELLKKVDSRYTLVVMVSKRARQLLEGAEPLVNAKGKKVLSLAVQEIADGEVTYTRPSEEELEEKLGCEEV